MTNTTLTRLYAAQILNVLQIEVTDTNVKQAQVMIDALLKFREKNAIYVDLWKDGGAEDSVRHCGHKADRLKAFVKAFKLKGGLTPQGSDLPDSHEEAMKKAFQDDGLDLINYAAFALRNLHSHRLSANDGDIRDAS